MSILNVQLISLQYQQSCNGFEVTCSLNTLLFFYFAPLSVVSSCLCTAYTVEFYTSRETVESILPARPSAVTGLLNLHRAIITYEI